MPTNPLVGVLTPQIRQTLYVIMAVLGLALGAVQIAYGAGDWGQPVWLTVSLSVYAFLGTALGTTAASNIAEADPQPGPDNVVR